MKLTVWDACLAQAIRRLYEEYLQNRAELSADMRDIALKAGGLPVYSDMGGCLIITPEGEVIEYDWDSGTYAPTVEDIWRKTAQARAAEEFAELRALGTRPQGAKDCEACLGKGNMTNEGLQRIVRCHNCGGLGFDEA